ncbi:MAG: hypothetical protein K0U74_01855 [Alphaproteobacteria bacterium]|nr:hypothetical protein [Alphaproteobacteria bacterium]
MNVSNIKTLRMPPKLSDPICFLKRGAAATLVALLALMIFTPDAHARRDANQFIASLSSKDRQAFEKYLAAKTFHEAAVDAFWAKVNAKRKSRRKKKRAGKVITSKDYVNAYPPKYDGPQLSKALSRAWRKYLTADQPKTAKKRRELPGIPVYLRAAKKVYGFVPTRIREREFKRRYAAEALRLGLNADQVVRVYALETSGLGTADMQAGIHPIKRTGKPISSALGYAQLLAANSVNELQKHGKTFLRRLQELARQPGLSSARAKELKDKIAALKRMIKRVGQVPRKWSYHRKFARTQAGRGIHPINIDGDIGPWLQVIKLKGIHDTARRAGRPGIGPTELELMNLAGPGTGLEMMTSVGLGMPTVNFFSRRGYERNTIVRDGTSKDLLRKLKKRMDYNVKNSGAVEFYEVFREAAQQRRAQR